MILPVAEVVVLAQRCAPHVAARTLVTVASAESRLDPYAIHVNGGSNLVYHPGSAAAAVARATALRAQGFNFDMGLGQVNVANMGWLGLSFDRAFEPCANLAAAGRVLTHSYALAARRGVEPQRALRIAFSLYNTGRSDRGFSNGYVRRIEREGARIVPQVDASWRAAPPAQGSAMIDSESPRRVMARVVTEPARWDTWKRAEAASAQYVFDQKRDRVEPRPREVAQ